MCSAAEKIMSVLMACRLHIKWNKLARSVGRKEHGQDKEAGLRMKDNTMNKHMIVVDRRSFVFSAVIIREQEILPALSSTNQCHINSEYIMHNFL